jgi:predicted transposase YbfD/YdcC
MAPSPSALRKSFRRLPDPRIDRCKRHLLLDILTMALCAVTGGADTWTDIATFARRRKDWFGRFLELPNGIPSHHTFRRLFNRLDPVPLQQGLVQWLHRTSEALGFRHIAIDGKTLRHSRGGSSPLHYLHLVSAWATEANLTLGQVAVEEKSNEITAIPRLLELLDLHGALVTIDAIGCQREIARQIVERGGHYVLTVKNNQEHLLEDIQNCFARGLDTDFAGMEHSQHATSEAGHGRQEKRWYHVIHRPEGIRDQEAWANLCTIGMCYSERTVQGQTSTEVRYFIGSRPASARWYGKALRNHWRIENCLHWQMDVTFGEDASGIHDRRGGANFATLRRTALGLLKRHPGAGSVRSKRYEATLDMDFLEEVLKGNRMMGKVK